MIARPAGRLALGLVLSFAAPGGAQHSRADDWPQWMGPRRDNIWRETGLLEQFPATGPRIVWRAPVAYGFSGPAVASGRVYVTDLVTDADVTIANFERTKIDGTERLLCLDQRTGDVLWTREDPVTYTVSYPAGPRATPVIDGGRVYSLGAEGRLDCLDAAAGTLIWTKNFATDYGAETPLWGYAAHPLVDGPRLVCLVGGAGSHAVAFDKATGREIWRALTSAETGYSPPTIIEAAGVRQLILAQPEAIAAVNPETGVELWSVPFHADGGCVIMSPVQSGEYLFVGSHQNKSLLLKLAADKPGAEVVWHDRGKDAIAPINVQPQAVDGVLYGLDQRGMLRGIDLAAGKQLWETSQPLGPRPLSSGTAMIVRQGDRYWMFTEAGELAIARLAPQGFTELGRAKVIDPSNVVNGRDVVWTMPAFAGRCAFIRNDRECICVDLSADQKATPAAAGE